MEMALLGDLKLAYTIHTFLGAVPLCLWPREEKEWMGVHRSLLVNISGQNCMQYPGQQDDDGGERNE